MAVVGLGCYRPYGVDWERPEHVITAKSEDDAADLWDGYDYFDSQRPQDLGTMFREDRVEYCEHAWQGWVCTREPGHEGDHIGHDEAGYVVARWWPSNPYLGLEIGPALEGDL